MNVPARWVPTRLRSAPLAALLTAALALAATFLAAGLPRALDRGADQALRSYLRSSGPVATSLTFTSAARYGTGQAVGLDRVRDTLVDRIGATVRTDPSGPVYGSRTVKSRTLLNPELDRPDGLGPELALLYVAGARDRVRLTAGQWPAPATPVDPAAPTDSDAPIPVVLSADAAATIGARLGSVLDAGQTERVRKRAEVVGLFTATDPADPYWAELGCPHRACLNTVGEPPPLQYWYVTALADAGSLHLLNTWSSTAEDFWRVPVDVDALRADRLRQTAYDLAALTTGPAAVDLTTETGRRDLRIASPLRPQIEQARDRQSGADALIAVGPAGAVGVAAVVLCLAAALTAERRTDEFRLLRARGAGAGGIWRLLLGEGALTVLPGAALGALLAFALLPTPRWTTAAVAAGAATLLALLAFPVKAVAGLRERRPAARAARRRLVAELVVLAATVAAVTQAGRRGVAPPGEGADPLLVSAPLLLALTGALLLARLQPMLIGALARRARSRPGLIGFLGLARAARGGTPGARPSVLPLLALLLAVVCGAFGATVLDAVGSHRLQVARQSVGGDASVSAAWHGTLPAAFTEAAARLPGVHTALPVWTREDLTLVAPEGGSAPVKVVLADPVRYAELARTAGRGQFDPALLAVEPGGPNGPVPALITSDLPPGDYKLRSETGAEVLAVHTVGTMDGTPALSGSTTTLLLPSAPALARQPQFGDPNRWFATGRPDEGQLRELARQFLGETTTTPPVLRTSAGLVEQLAANPLQHEAERLFWASGAGTALFAVLSVLLTLLRAAPERAAMLARLRTMGLRPRQGLALILAEALPGALVAAFGGALVAVACVALLGPAVDLSPLVGAPVPAGLRPALGPIAGQALGLALLATVAVLAEAAVTARRQITTELRAGDNR